MTAIRRSVLEQLIDATAEPLLLACVDQAEWPIVLCNPAFEALADQSELLKQPVTDVIESLHGREAASELSETIRSRQGSSIPLDYAGRSWLLMLKPLDEDGGDGPRYYAVCWRDSATMTSGGDASVAHQALLRARRRIRDLSRDDALTGLLNEAAFRDVLAHDWAVAARDEASVALISFRIQDFAAYLRVFGRHATDSCLRRVAQALRRCLRRASDVAARVTTGEEDRLLVLFHASEEQAVADFANVIAREVRGLGLHHPHSRKDRFVTVAATHALRKASGGPGEAQQFLNELLAD